MEENPKAFLEHILESISMIESYTKNLSQKEFLNSTQIQDAVMRRLEIIGEAITHIIDDFRGKYPEIPWQKIMGMRNMLIHEYFGISLKLVWDTVKKNVPELKQQIEKIYSDYNF